MSAPLWTSDAIARATGGTASGDFAVTGVAFDSREVGPGDLFVALRGETADGHDYVARAQGAGAAGVLVSRPVEGPHVLVADTTAALTALAEEARRRTEAKIIGVTGSVGKTGVKEALWRALDRKAPGCAHRSVKSYNNHVGVPLSLARMPQDSRYGVFEMGMNHAGELSDLTRIVRPHVAVITTIAPAHIGNLGSEEAIADAKAEIFEGLEPGGIALIPADSIHAPHLWAVAERYAARVISFGLSRDADVRAMDHVPGRDGGTMITAALPGGVISYTLALPGDHWIANSLAVMAAVDAVGGDVAAAGLALAELPGMVGRGQRHTISLAAGQALLIDESYNANPASMAATLRQLGKEPARRRVAVLGAMKELGERSDELHAALAGPITDAALDAVLLVGEEMEPLARALAGRISVRQEADARAAAAALSAMVQDGDAVLVKGSNSIGLSRVVAAITGEDS